MAVIELHTGVPSSPKHAPLSDAAFRLWTHGLCWSKEHLTDGFIPSRMLPTLHPRGRKVVGELLQTFVADKGPLWHVVDGGYQIHDYADWQETKADVEVRRERARRHVYAREVSAEVRARDKDTCAYCGHAVVFGVTAPKGGTFDHVEPSGPATVANLVVACRSCNSRKRDRTPEQAGMQPRYRGAI